MEAPVTPKLNWPIVSQFPPKKPGEWVIYLLQFPGKSSKVYVGQTKNTLQVRLIKHFSKARTTPNVGCVALNQAICKYGESSLLAIELDRTTKDKVDELEQYYITLYNSVSPNGYNLDSGGCVNKEHSVVTRAKMSEAAVKREQFKNRSDPESYQINCKAVYPMRTGSSKSGPIMGYMVKGHILQRGTVKYFRDPLVELNELLQDAKDYVAKLESGLIKIAPPIGVPEEIFETKVGYCVLYVRPDGKRAVKRFSDSKRSKDEMLIEAISYLNSNKP